MTDPDDPYRALTAFGEVEEQVRENAAEHIDAVERRYRGNDEYLGDRSDRIVLGIRPRRVITR